MASCSAQSWITVSHHFQSTSVALSLTHKALQLPTPHPRPPSTPKEMSMDASYEVFRTETYFKPNSGNTVCQFTVGGKICFCIVFLPECKERSESRFPLETYK